MDNCRSGFEPLVVRFTPHQALQQLGHPFQFGNFVAALPLDIRDDRPQCLQALPGPFGTLVAQPLQILRHLLLIHLHWSQVGGLAEPPVVS